MKKVAHYHRLSTPKRANFVYGILFKPLNQQQVFADQRLPYITANIVFAHTEMETHFSMMALIVLWGLLVPCYKSSANDLKRLLGY